MNRILIIISITLYFFSNNLSAQNNSRKAVCNFEYEISNDTTICFKDSIFISVKPFTFDYLWTDINGDTLSVMNAAKVSPVDTAMFYVRIINDYDTCYDSVKVSVYSHIVFDEIIQLNEFCPGTCMGQAKVRVSGGYPPYEFDWSSSPFLHDSIAMGLCEKDNWVIAYDTKCALKDTFSLEVLDRPEIDFSTDIPDGDSVIYIENPIVNFFDESVDVENRVWNFGDSTETSYELNPVHTFPDTTNIYEVWLKATSIVTGCVDSVMHYIEVKPVELIIPNVITPNGDGKNDFFQISKDDNNSSLTPFPIKQWYINFHLIVFNRYGKKIYENKDYQNDWNAEDVSDGVYFYILKCNGYYSDETYKGSVTVLGSKK
ncbi:MAG: gliding motility-associated C-terminal domain-containing protein [Bacteroidales bacterium]|nr:gliding motility-associated C-terminal domain-containing protein [Bacteroidales bacterium]